MTHRPQLAQRVHPGKGWRRFFALIIAATILAGVFMLYLNPVFVMTMADQIWTCF
jgi:hypothetical protein